MTCANGLNTWAISWCAPAATMNKCAPRTNCWMPPWTRANPRSGAPAAHPIKRAAMHTLIPTLHQEALALMPRLVAWRRDFHMHPELGFQEVRTAGIVADHLRALGLEVSTGIGKTGVVAVVEGDQTNPDAPTVLLRFDMDALPVQEETGLPFAS